MAAQGLCSLWLVLLQIGYAMANERRKLLDHERYIKHREERLQKQREYYQAHKEYFVAYRHKRITEAYEEKYKKLQGLFIQR